MFCISDNHYIFFRRDLNLNDELPTIYRIKNLRESILGIFPIRKFGINGIANDMKIKLRSILIPRISRPADKYFSIENNEIKLKLCADSTNIGIYYILYKFEFE